MDAGADPAAPFEVLLAGDDLEVLRVRLAAGEAWVADESDSHRRYLLVLSGEVRSEAEDALTAGDGREPGEAQFEAGPEGAVMVVVSAPRAGESAQETPASSGSTLTVPETAAPEHAALVASALRATREDDLELLVAMEQSGDTARWLGPGGMEWHQQVLADPGMEHWVLVDRLGQVLGFGVLADVSTGPRVEIRRLVVLPEGRGQGLGRLLFRLLFQQAVADPAVTEVWLDVSTGNHRAITIYRGLGFVEEPCPEWAHLEEDGTFMRWSADR